MRSATVTDRKRVLLVDDDRLTLKVIEFHLGRLGCESRAVASAEDALRAVEREGVGAFDLVLSDYWMPGENGIELLKALQLEDPTLSVVLITANEEREIVESVLRQGGAGFLLKPVRKAELSACVSAGVERTRRLRRLRATEREAFQLGTSQRALLERHLSLAWPELEFFYASKSQASGDYFSVFPLAGGRRVLLASDGSGHDLSSAFQSNYFHGLARGLLTCGAGLGQVFESFNDLLLKEWTGPEGRPQSLAGCALEFDFAAGRIGYVNAGFPRPMLAGGDGFAVPLGPEVAGPPLGWFPERYVVSSEALDFGSLQVWTDGLTDQAERIGVDPLSLAYRLLDGSGETEDLASSAVDDVAVARLLRNCPDRGAASHLPLIAVEIPGDHLDLIDAWQTYFEKSLRLALGRLDGERLAEMTLCWREGLANALRHGCGGSAQASARAQVSVCRSTGEVAIRIADGGPGHAFDAEAHKRLLEDELVCEHRGLMVMASLPLRFEQRDGGRCVRMDFSLN